MTPFSKEELLRAASVLGIEVRSSRLDLIVKALEDAGQDESSIRAALRAPRSPAAVSGQVDAVASAVRDAEDRMLANYRDLLGQIVGTGTRIDAVAQSVADLDAATRRWTGVLSDKMAAMHKQPVNMDAGQIKLAVAEAFKPIRQALKAAPAPVYRRVVAAAPRERRPIQQVFGIEMEGDCEVWGEPGHFDSDYVWQPEQLRLALLALESGDNFWLAGERGTGKTQFAANLAARLGRPFYRVSFDANLERAEFVGADGLVAGKTVWKDGLVLQAFRTPGAICLLDEISTGRAEYITTLHALLERDSEFVITSTGERVQRAPGMIFVAADNTNGCGDTTGRYAGTRTQNAALVDRFAFTLQVSFLPAEQEIALLVKHGAEPEIARKLINVFTRCRASVGGSLIEPPSLRNAFAFARYVRVVSPEQAWEITVVNKSPEESQQTLRALFTEHWEA